MTQDTTDNTTDDVLLTDISEGIATVTMHRPKAMNALSKALRKAIWNTFGDLNADTSVAAVVLTGADPAFCAGLDLKELAAGDDALADTGASGSTDSGRGPMPPMSKPVIGAVNGVAITGGFEVALACDFLIASERARFADTHARMGIMPGWGLTVELPAAIGIRRAREMSFTGNFLDAETACAWGLVNRVVPHAELLPTARHLATDIVSNDPAGVGRIRQTYREGSLTTGEDAWRIEGEAAGAWQSGGLDPAEIEKRRQAVTARGREQT